jgi:hypothetical protein
LVLAAFDAPSADGGVLVVVEEEVAVESDGGLDGVDVADTGLVEGAASMMTVRVEVAVRQAADLLLYGGR